MDIWFSKPDGSYSYRLPEWLERHSPAGRAGPIATWTGRCRQPGQMAGVSVRSPAHDEQERRHGWRDSRPVSLPRKDGTWRAAWDRTRQLMRSTWSWWAGARPGWRSVTTCGP